MIRFSFTNLAAATGVIFSASSESAGYPAANLATAAQPFNPARTTATGDQWWMIDLGTPLPLGVLAVIRSNVAQVRIEADTTDSWGGAGGAEAFVVGDSQVGGTAQVGGGAQGALYSSGLLTIGRNRWNGRYHHGIRPNVTARYVRIIVPSQTPVDGQVDYYQLGGVWVGSLAAPPRDIDLKHELERLEAWRDEEPDHGGWEQRSVVGEPRTLLRATRRIASGTVPGVADSLADWLDLELSFMATDTALVTLYDTPANTWVMRRTTAATTWAVAYPWATSDLELREVIR